ncbi:hypothetical protein EJB05_47883, partial [Eragrostis curvula]
MTDLLLLAVVTMVASKAADALVQSVTRMWGVDPQRDKLERQLLAVQCVLADAEVKAETNPVVRRWMKELKAAAYQADDVLDDIQYEGLRQEAQDGAASKILRYFTLHSPLMFRLTVSRDLNKVLKKFDELVLEMHTIGLVECVEVPQPLYQQAHATLDDSADVFVRGHDKEIVVKLLLDQQDKKNVQVLPITGIGGLGKTTLVKMVYNDCRVQKHFELKMWHCVSENFKATDVLRSIIELATNEPARVLETVDFLRQRLHGVIGRQRFLLILDDVWNDEQRKWEEYLRPLLCIGGSGSMIILTSRSQQVASTMGTLPLYELACLSEDDSWELFSKKAFSRVKEKDEFILTGKRIVNRCKGLPLALKTLGGLMSSKEQVQEWEAIAESNISNTSRGKDEVLSLLKLSFRHLPSEMKRCFAFCAVFPKGYEMDKDKLIQLWMANGFIHEEGTMDLAQKGEFIFNELVKRSFLQDVTPKIIFLQRSMHDIVGCKMHDLMHDLAKDVTDECASAEELSQGKTSIKDVYHMQVSWCELKEISGLLKGASSLRTLLTRSEHKHLRELRLMSLRALCCENSSITHCQLINAAHLRYLDLSGSNIVSLPNLVCLLYNLQSLWLNGCSRLCYLPEGMQIMRKLSHLYLLGCDSLERMPPNLSRLPNLRTLTTFIVDTGDGFGIEELKDLRQLGNRLELFNLWKVKSGSKVNLQEKHTLSELLLYWGRDRDYDPFYDKISNNDEEVLESLVPHDQLKVLKIHGYGGLAMSQWMRDPKMFQFLRELVITECPNCNELPLVWLSSSLEDLSLSGMLSLTTLCKSIDLAVAGFDTPLPIFPKLKRMMLRQLLEFEKWAENSSGEPISSVMFPLLEELRIINCYKLGSLPDCPALRYLSTRGHTSRGLVPMSMLLGSCPTLVQLDVGLLEDVVKPQEDPQSQIPRPLGTLRKLNILGEDGFMSIFNMKLQLWDCLASVEQVDIFSCHSIVYWPLEELRCLPRLRSLGIWFCNKLEGKGSSSNEILPLPQLEWLSVHSCESLLEIPKLPTSLEEIKICHNGSLVSLPSNLGNLAKLRHLYVEDCATLKALPDRMDGLISLEGLMIEECPGIEKFPQGLVQRLPALKLLEIKACPDLQRRCRHGGEYFDLITCIPNKDVPAAESNMKNCHSKTLVLYLKMDRLRRIAGRGKAKAPAAVQNDNDESIIFFREMYKREKDRDVNLLEPMYSVEFDAIQGGHVRKVPSGKRDFLIPVDEKHDYDWLKSTPATPLFPSLEMEATSSKIVFQKEPPIPPREAKPSASKVSGKPEATKTSARTASPKENSSSKKTFVKGAPTITKVENHSQSVAKRSSHKVPVNGQQKATAAAVSAPRSSGATKKHSDRCYASQIGSTTAVKGVTEQDFLFKTPKNLITTGSIFRRHIPSAEKARTKDPGLGAGVKKENGKARRQSCPPAATRGTQEQPFEGRQNVLPPTGRKSHQNEPTHHEASPQIRFKNLSKKITIIGSQETHEQGSNRLPPLSSIARNLWLPSAHCKPFCAIRHAGAWRWLRHNRWMLTKPAVTGWRSAHRMMAISVVAVILTPTATPTAPSSPSPLPHSTLVMEAIFSL